jgi:large subunit ribosomal protein L24|tara:strand:+ start:8093 stop:8482 length:390 start_codon:yes stop_codon:yes gene_type:complete
VKTKFSSSWKKSIQPRKQRKYRHKAPLHIRQKFVSVHLSKELRKKYNKRSMNLRKGDGVNVMRGQFRKKTGKINGIDIKKTKVYVDGIEVVKKDGTKARYPIHPSNLVITELNMDDKMRNKIVKRVEGN